MRLEDLRIGSRVHYRPSHFKPSQYENGIVKELRATSPDSAWVVFNCGGEWDHYQDYTAAKTSLSDLEHGWFNHE